MFVFWPNRLSSIGITVVASLIGNTLYYRGEHSRQRKRFLRLSDRYTAISEEEYDRLIDLDIGGTLHDLTNLADAYAKDIPELKARRFRVEFASEEDEFIHLVSV